MGFWDPDKGKNRPVDPYGPARRDPTSKEIREAEMNLHVLLDAAAAWAQCRLTHKVDFRTESWEGEGGFVLQHQSKGWTFTDAAGKTTVVRGSTPYFLVDLAQALAKAAGKDCPPFPLDQFGAEDEPFRVGFVHYFKGNDNIPDDLLSRKNEKEVGRYRAGFEAATRARRQWVAWSQEH